MLGGAPASFFSLPAEIRNEIYILVFTNSSLNVPLLPDEPSMLHTSLGLGSSKFHAYPTSSQNAESTFGTSSSTSSTSSRLAPLLTCKQFNTEAQLLALSLTRFHLTSSLAFPDHFYLRTSLLGTAKLGAIKHLTLTARTAHLHALNETWAGMPFGHPSLRLETLTIVPRRACAANTAYAEVADLSQIHTLAYILAETLKALKGVKQVRVVNNDCFNEGMWWLLYLNLIFRLWRWGGEECGVRFETSEDLIPLRRRMVQKTAVFDGWFHALLGEQWCGDRGREVGKEIQRLRGRDGHDPPDAVGT